MKKFRTPNIILLVFVCLIIICCRSETNRPKPSLTSERPVIEITRFDKSLAALDSNDFKTQIADLFQKHPVLLPLYLERLVPLVAPGSFSESSIDEIDLQHFSNYLHSTSVQKIDKAIDSIYNDLAFLKSEFEEAFAYSLHYFPDKEIPKVYTLHSEYSYFPFLFVDGNNDESIGIGLDMFLGEKYPYQKISNNAAVFSDYNLPSLKKEYIVKKSFDVYLDEIIPKPTSNKLLDIMVYNGIKLYFLGRILPEIKEEILFEYNSDQLKWCRENEYDVWSFFIAKEMLYSSENVHKYTEPAPRAQGMPADAPGRIANWVGYQIVQSYVARHGEESLSDLIHPNDAQNILRKSKYKPRR